MRLTNRLGDRYERLVVIERAPNAGGKDTNARWLCQCDCGKATIAYGQDLARGKVKSCGCLNAERIVRHGMARTHGYKAWQSMWQRCDNPKTKGYANYGGRGIKVCERWRDYPTFLADMGDRPVGYTLERIDNNRGYEPDNCRWATYKEQNSNHRGNRWMTLNGQTKTVAQWVVITGLSRNTIRARLRCGWTDEQTLTVPHTQGTSPTWQP